MSYPQFTADNTVEIFGLEPFDFIYNSTVVNNLTVTKTYIRDVNSNKKYPIFAGTFSDTNRTNAVLSEVLGENDTTTRFMKLFHFRIIGSYHNMSPHQFLRSEWNEAMKAVTELESLMDSIKMIEDYSDIIPKDRLKASYILQRVINRYRELDKIVGDDYKIPFAIIVKECNDVLKMFSDTGFGVGLDDMQYLYQEVFLNFNIPDGENQISNPMYSRVISSQEPIATVAAPKGAVHLIMDDRISCGVSPDNKILHNTLTKRGFCKSCIKITLGKIAARKDMGLYRDFIRYVESRN